MTKNDSNKPNTRSRNKNSLVNSKDNIKKKSKSEYTNSNDIYKINNGNDDDENDDEDIDSLLEIDDEIENEVIDEEVEEEKNLKRKFEEIFDNNTIIFINNSSEQNKRLPSFNELFDSVDNSNMKIYDDEENDDDDFGKMIQDSKKYIEKNPNFSNYNEDEANYFLNSSVKNKNKINKFEKKTIELNKEKIPLRFKIINSKIDDNLKAIALKKLNHLSSMNERSGEYFKILNYVENLCKIPCGIYKKLNIPKQPKDVSNFLLNSYNILNKNVYGH